jgi:prepilin-type processing-associated H-X9-DG protein
MVTAIPAIICGITGLVKISKNKGQLKGTGLAVTGIVIPVSGIVLIPIMAMILAILMPALGKTRQLAQRMVCATNLSGLGKAMIVYANDYNDTYPTADKWCDLLVEKCDVAKEQFYCPSSGAEKGESSYVLNINLAGKKASQVPPDMVLVFETQIRTVSCKGKQESCYMQVLPDKNFWNLSGGRELLCTKNHQGDGCNVLYVDGHCKFEKDPNSLRWTVE